MVLLLQDKVNTFLQEELHSRFSIRYNVTQIGGYNEIKTHTHTYITINHNLFLFLQRIPFTFLNCAYTVGFSYELTSFYFGSVTPEVKSVPKRVEIIAG